MYRTRVLSFPESSQIKQASTLLLREELIVVPTETVYGLAADARSESACQKVFVVKGRPADNPLIVHCSSAAMASAYAKNTRDEEKKAVQYAMRLFSVFSPGALSVIVYASDSISRTARAGGATVALRIPAHRLFRNIIAAAGIPVAAPSANISGRPSPTDAEKSYRELNGKVKLIIDGGQCPIGIESTIVDCTTNPPRILRPGAISRAKLCSVLGKEICDTTVIRSKKVVPGNYHHHYRPHCPVYAVERNITSESVDKNLFLKSKPLVYLRVRKEPDQRFLSLTSIRVESFYSWDELARCLYRAFLDAESSGMEAIFVDCPKIEEHEALRDRILRASRSIL